MEKNVNKMRIPPVWVAIVTASATLSLSNPVSGQTISFTQSNSELADLMPAQPETGGALGNPEGIGDLWQLIGQAEPQDPSSPSVSGELTAAEVLEPVAVSALELPVQNTPDSGKENVPAQGHKNTERRISSPSRILNLSTPQSTWAAMSALESIAQTPPSPEPGAGEENPDAAPTLPAPEETAPTPTPSAPEETAPTPTPSAPEQTAPPAPGPVPTPTSDRCPDPNAPQVLVAEVVVSGVEGELQDKIYQAIRTQPGRTTNRCQLQEDVNAIFATGFFGAVDYQPEDTPLGVRVTFAVQQNPVLRNVTVNVVPVGEGQQVVPQSVIDTIFGEQYGEILNLRRFQEGVKQLNKWYQDNGYILAQVVNASQVDAQGTVTLQVAEGIIEDIQVRFLTEEGETTDDKGNPVDGRTREFIITREMQLQAGDVLNRDTLVSDLQRVFGLGIFEKVEPSLNPGQDPRKVLVVLDITERNTGSVAAGAGISSATGLFGTLSYQEQNLGGNNQKLGAQLQVGERALLFDVNFTDPWIAGDPYRTSYTVNGFRRRSISLIYTGGEDQVYLPDGDRPRLLRLGGGVTFNRPLGPDPLNADWQASLGLQYQRITIRNSDGDISPEDELGNDLSFSGDGKDDLTTLQFGLVRDLRDDRAKPTRGSVLRFGTEQSVPIGKGSILLNRLRGSYSYYIPVNYVRFSEGPQTLAFNVQAGTVVGDLPPYEAFALGGSNSVRGYDEGDLGSGRSFIQATAEYRFPIFAIVGGALFADFGTDLGTGSSVPGNPAGVRDKPGSGFGYGLGVRINSPLGPIRVDYGFNDEGEGRFHFGIGERF